MSPAFRVLEAVGRFKGGNLVQLGSGEEGPVAGLGMEWPGHFELVVANLEPTLHRVTLIELAGPVVNAWRLGEASPDEGAAWTPIDARLRERRPQECEIELEGYGVVRLAGYADDRVVAGCPSS